VGSSLDGQGSNALWLVLVVFDADNEWAYRDYMAARRLGLGMDMYLQELEELRRAFVLLGIIHVICRGSFCNQASRF
jgi:hypothetical protein